MTTTRKLSPGELMAWVQAQRRCPICKEEQCDCWQALAAVPALLEALRFVEPYLEFQTVARQKVREAIAQATKETP